MRVVSNVEPEFAQFWHPVATIDELAAKPLHVEVAGRHYVIARLGGALTAFEDACPHRGFPLSEGTIAGDRLRCAYHGYCFETSGACVAIPALPAAAPIPAKADLVPAAGVVEHLGFIWVAPEPPRSPLPQIPEIEDPRFGCVIVGPQTWQAGAAQMTENFLDVSHFPFVHGGTFGIEADAEMPPYSVVRDGLTFSFEYGHRFRNDAEVVHLQGAVKPEQRRRITSRFYPPFGVEFRVDYEETGVTTVLLTLTQPVDRQSSRLFGLLLGTDINDTSAVESLDFEEKILWEDQLILERYREREMVLDVEAQFHTAADKMTVEYRRVMAEILSAGSG